MLAFFLSLLRDGGLFFTGPIAFAAFLVLGLTVKKSIDLFGPAPHTPAELERGLPAILALGIGAFVFGVLGQVLGLMQAFNAIEAVGDISPALLAGGLKVSMIPTMLGLCTMFVAGSVWFVLRSRYRYLVDHA
jgi:hypothetical protein